MRPVRLRPLGFALLLGAGCASSAIRPHELPEEPVAFVFRSESEATHRLEILERARGQAPDVREGTARLEDVGALLGLADTPAERQAAMLGRVALYDARLEDVREQSWALRGARPLDWSADHRRLLFASPRDGEPQIFEYDLDTGDILRVTRGPEMHPSACYGPDGRIAYQEVQRDPKRRGFSRIYVTSRGRGAPRPVTPGPADAAPSWSADGRWLVYTINTSAPRIASVDLEAGTEPRAIARGRDADFTPDGAWVVYTAPSARGWRLRRMRPDGSGKLPMGSGPADDEYEPTVSPDGRFVIYTSERNRRHELRVRNLDGRGDRPLVGRGDGFSPVWN